MKHLIFILVFCVTSFARADGEIWLPNIPGYATGTSSGGKNGLDVNINSGSIPIVLPSGSPLPVILISPSPVPVVLVSPSPVPVVLVSPSPVPVILISPSPLPISAASLPLPTGAATSANQTNGSQKSQIVDGSGNVIASTSNALNVQVANFPATQPVSGTVAVTQSTSPWVNNISQFGGNSVVTGTGASGSGIPRVTVANDSNILATQSGTWTVQPGNTANTTPWLATINQGGNSASVSASNALKVDGSAVTQPVSMSAPNAPINPAGSFTQSTTVGSSGATTLTKPANAVGFVLYASSSNAQNIRYAVGATASTTSGMRLEPGRDTGYVPVAANVSVEAEAGSNQEVDIQWVLNQ